jgi:regulator of sirC expression with transglutaminase-like and TPR domain
MGQTEKAIADLERFLELSDNPQWRQMIEQHLADLKQE